MSKFISASMLLVLAASGTCSAADSSACQPGCAEDKRECRDLAQHAAKMENSPLAPMNEKIPHTRYTGDGRARDGEIRANALRDFQERKHERSRACDEKYMQCVRTCTSPAAEPDQGSAVLKRKGEL